MKSVNLKEIAEANPALAKYVPVGSLNDLMLNIIQVDHSNLDFHIHNDTDEMFYIIEGFMQLAFADTTVDLNEGEFLHCSSRSTPQTCNFKLG